jgi:hypothetical protein
MTSHTAAEIAAFVRENLEEDYEGANEVQHLTVEVESDGDGWRLTLTKMYGYVPVNFAFLFKLSEFFGGTKNVNDNRYASAGCDSCDYGSSYTVTLTVKP